MVFLKIHAIIQENEENKMNHSTIFLLAKFGNKEHLEQLQNGNIFFNAIQTYRNDGTSYRGDSMEGKIPVDPTKVMIFDREGKDIFEMIPRPDTVVQSFVGDEELMMFCAAAITTEIMDNTQENKWRFKNEFKSAIQNFGEYVLLLWSTELLEHIESAIDLSGQKIGYDSGPVLYRDLNDFENTEEYRKTGRWLDVYFVKGLPYKNQNEWRTIIVGEREPLKANCGSGFLLQTPPFQHSWLMRTADLFDGEIEIRENIDEN